MEPTYALETMRNPESALRRRGSAGFTLPAILVVVGALLILAVGALLLVGIERNTARSYVERERAELAARAGLEDVKGLLVREASNDEFLILQNALSETKVGEFINAEDEENPQDLKKSPVPYLYLARGTEKGYRYAPLFSTKILPEFKPSQDASEQKLELPELVDLLGEDALDSKGRAYSKFSTLPYYNDVRATWLPVKNEKGRMVSRYAYWVEDLQGRADAGTAGNTKDGGVHKRYGWKDADSKFAQFPAPGLNAEDSKPRDDGRDAEPPLDQVALYQLDDITGAKDNSDLDKTIIEGRKTLISPDSVLAAAGVLPPLTRDEAGHLLDLKAQGLEENLTAEVQPYDEQAVVPFATGIDPSVSGKPKLNLNSLLAKSPGAAVDEMAEWIRKGLPDFDSRKGGFPSSEDYLKTLAANAIGYAAKDNKPVVKLGEYRGLGACPTLSEISLAINYLGYRTQNGNKIMNYQFVLFAELYNHTNIPITNQQARLSYEVGLYLPPMGAAPASITFDDEGLISDPVQCPQNKLTREDGKYWTEAQTVSLLPGQYKFYKFATVNYLINVGSGAVGSNFVLSEEQGARGISLKWNDEEVDRVPKIIRASTGLTFNSGLRRYFGKAAIPGHSYGPYGSFINNMGDSRMAHYITGVDLGENKYPYNISPNRRNIRYNSVYSLDKTPEKNDTYGRVIPSEWPDGGHDTEVTMWSTGWSDAREGDDKKSGTGPSFDPTTIPENVIPQEGESVTFLSRYGRFYSATELGRLYDPIMYVPTFDPEFFSTADSVTLRGDGTPTDKAGKMPKGGAAWPLVQVASAASSSFGGGNTLRIGRPEHPKFNQDKNHSVKHPPNTMPGTHAARLLDLFHAGKSRSEKQSEREASLVRIEGHVNINTASRDTLRAMAAGYLTMDPKLSKRAKGDAFDSRMAPAISELTLSAPADKKEADKIADAIIARRPYISPSELACVTNPDDKPVFGNPQLYPSYTEREYTSQIQWTDAAAEEVFARVYEASTVRSRNFRVWVVGQSVAPTSEDNQNPEVLSEVRKSFTIFADPGERKSDGTIDPAKSRISILHENDF